MAASHCLHNIWTGVGISKRPGKRNRGSTTSEITSVPFQASTGRCSLGIYSIICVVIEIKPETYTSLMHARARSPHFFLTIAGPCNSIPQNSIAVFFISFNMKYKWLKMFIKSFNRSLVPTRFEAFSTLFIHFPLHSRSIEMSIKWNLLNAGTRPTLE